MHFLSAVNQTINISGVWEVGHTENLLNITWCVDAQSRRCGATTQCYDFVIGGFVMPAPCLCHLTLSGYGWS